jgi:hypothetical protein
MPSTQPLLIRCSIALMMIGRRVARCAGCFRERFQPGSEGAGDPPVEQRDRSRGFQAGTEDCAELFFHLIRPPDPAAGTFHLGELCGLGVGEVFGVLE